MQERVGVARRECSKQSSPSRSTRGKIKSTNEQMTPTRIYIHTATLLFVDARAAHYWMPDEFFYIIKERGRMIITIMAAADARIDRRSWWLSYMCVGLSIYVVYMNVAKNVKSLFNWVKSKLFFASNLSCTPLLTHSIVFGNGWANFQKVELIWYVPGSMQENPSNLLRVPRSLGRAAHIVVFDSLVVDGPPHLDFVPPNSRFFAWWLCAPLPGNNNTQIQCARICEIYRNKSILRFGSAFGAYNM